MHDRPEEPLYDFHSDAGQPRRRRDRGAARWRLPALIAVAVVALAGGGWYIFGHDRPQPVATEVPLLAPEGPLKTAPEDPGGMEFSHRDKSVYNLVGKNTEEGPVERLLPPPETPVPVTPAEPESAAPAQDMPVLTPVRPAPGQPQDAPAAPPADVSAPTASTAAPALPPPPVVAKPAKPRAAAAPESGRWQIQLGAWQSAAAAARVWEARRKAYPDLLGGLTHAVSQIRVSGKGDLHRLRAGPLKDRAAAEALCAALKQRQTGCVVVPPNV